MKPKEKRIYTLKKFADIDEIGSIVAVVDQHRRPGPLEETVKLFTEHKYEPMSARDWAYASINLGIGSKFFQIPCTLREGAAHLPKPEPKIILVRNPPLLENYEYVTQAHEARLEVPLTKKLEEEYLQRISSKDKSIVEVSGIRIIKTEDFPANKAMHYVFYDQAEDIGLFFDRHGIPETTFFVEDTKDVKKQKRPYTSHLWYGGIPERHAIFSLVERYLHQSDILIWGTKIPDKRRK